MRVCATLHIFNDCDGTFCWVLLIVVGAVSLFRTRWEHLNIGKTTIDSQLNYQIIHACSKRFAQMIRFFQNILQHLHMNSSYYKVGSKY